MATNVQRGGLGFEKFFRRRSSSIERTKDPEKGVKSTKDDTETSAKEEKETNPSKLGKFFGQKSAGDKNDSPDDPKTATEDIDEASSQKTNESKKSSKKKKPGSSPESTSGKADDKHEDSEACKEYVIRDNVGQVKLTEIINNSIKEAVLNIVKESVCPLADTLELRAKDTAKKCSSFVGQDTQNKENKPGSPKHLPSLPSGANKTFDSHLCQTQYQQSLPISSRNSWKLNDQHERVTVNQCVRELSPRVNKNRKVAKNTKQKNKSVREVSPKICRQSKGQSSHFTTDKRRMTGNVNIYICSEANENAKEKPKNKKDCVDDSESGTSSSLSVSTSKLVAALRKKQRKNVEDQSLSCICEMPESSVNQYKSDSKMGEDDDVLCICNEDSAEAEFPDTQSTTSRDACVCEDTKFSDLDFPSSELGNLDQPCNSATSDEYGSYDKDFWPCTDQDCSSYNGSIESKKCNVLKEGNSAEQNLEDCCSCCNVERCKKDRPIAMPCPRNWKSQPERRKSRDKTCRTSCNAQQFNKCLCVVEEEDEDCCNDRKESVEKFTVCGMPSTDEENGQNKKVEPDKNPSRSHSGISKAETEKAISPKAERKKAARISENVSINSETMPDKKDESVVENDIDLKPKSPKTTLLTAVKKNFKRSSGKKNQERKTSPETPKEEEQVEHAETDENRTNSVVPKNGDDSVPPIAGEKQRSSFFYRSMKKAMGIVKTRKVDDIPVEEDDKKNRKPSPEPETKLKLNDDVGTNGKESEKDDQSYNENKKKSTLNSGITLKQEKRSRSRISTAIASRRSPAATSNESSNVSITCNQANKSIDGPTNASLIPDTTKAEGCGQELQSCKCGKLFDRSDCCCKKPKPPEHETCKCHMKCKKTSSGTSVCCKKLESLKRESCAKCGNRIDKCICCNRTSEPIESDPCKCCPSCSRPIPECKCCWSKQDPADQEFCNCCRRPKRLCCCDLEENSRANRSQLKKCCKPRDFQENSRQCSSCCSPKEECRCGQTFSNWECPKSMICIYCDKPQDNCTCKAPIRKCSQCGLPLDVCNCKPLPCCDCSGRQIVQAEDNERQTICVTAWKPRRSVRRYFAREQNHADSEEDCACYEKSKPYGSDRLAYQKGTVFSDVMSELQQKMSGSVCCNICRNVPCNCCCTETEDKVERRPRQRLSPIAEKRCIRQSQDRSRSKSPIESCRCEPPHRKMGRKVPAPKICDRCRTSPCRCRRSSASPKKKPPAKCYYCKSLPCICAPPAEFANPRPFKKAESSHRRRKECNSTEEHVNVSVKNEDNGHRGRESNHVVPCPGRQQPRKYCYRRNAPEQHTLNPRERVR